MNIEDKRQLESDLRDFSHGKKEYYKITRIEAQYLADLTGEDWRK